ncbi:hypothetical protein CY34DRAFT_238038 [Suillus luteus UH-Slu-Lm8-n1]|uniref:Uncharacterized protein n=1 Tax=Suillus luteus UH-Slu-Lm8-n1 TaxID=930992 RepID=A0A0D0AGR9_9AGAM|nr:hypothetical protein CY34DRAFT_238038 [Suillus luteus UH-Slu-Lm8-n1]
MDHAHYNPLDAQHSDPLLRTRTGPVSLFNTSASKLITGQGPCVRTERARARDVWLDHNAIDPLEGGSSDSDGSCSFHTCTSAVDTRATSPMPYGHDDIVVTRTIFRPNPIPDRGPTRTPSRMQTALTRIFSRWPSPTRTDFSSPSSSSMRPQSTPAWRSKRLARALNCFSPSSAITIERDADDTEMHKRKRPVLIVVVKETKERYEDDRAFKEIVMLATGCLSICFRSDSIFILKSLSLQYVECRK